jgi:putative oxidoreductase
MEKYSTLAGRILISALFLISGFIKLTHWQMMSGILASLKIPLAPIALAVTVVIEIAGALSIIAGYQARIAAVIQILYLIPVTLMMHNFWAFQGAQQQDQMAHFLKNLGIMGGLLFIAACGAGAISVDASRKKAGSVSPSSR